MSIKVNTAAINNTANKIKVNNDAIKNDFSEVISAINRMNSNWDGNASNAAISTFNKINNQYSSNRYNVINDMVVFLKKQVDENYTTTEVTINSAAAAFK